MSDWSIQPAMPHLITGRCFHSRGRALQFAAVGKRGLRYVVVHWYTYRTFVGVLLGTGLALVMFGLYTQEQTCGLGEPNCAVSLRVHPEDRLCPTADTPNPQVVVVGIDDDSIKGIGAYPFSRDKYATLLNNLAADGAAVVVFDVGFTEERAGSGDDLFQKALVNAKVPVVLAYGQCDGCTDYGDHQLTLKRTDQIPIRKFRCLDANRDPFATCTQPIKNVELGSTTVVTGNDAILRTMPMFVEPACHVQGRCDIASLNPISFVAYRDFFAQGSGIDLKYVPGEGATFGQAWT